MKDLITYDDFAKLDIRIGRILAVEDIDGADKLWKLTVDVGEERPRTICAGIKESFSADDLIGISVPVLINLAPRTLRGVESQGMMLLGGGAEDTLTLLTPKGDLPPGASIR